MMSLGLILASTLLVAKMIRPTTTALGIVCAAVGVIGAGFAFWLVGLESVQATDNLAYYFFCGMIAICAMILPGISGAFILLILGAYESITTIIKDLTHFTFTSGDLLKLAVFAAGCLVGLIGFAKLVRWLLANAHDLTMAVLCGFMLGSLRRIWPFQLDLTPDVEKLSHKRFENFTPPGWTSEVTMCVVIAAAAFSLVLALERLGRASAQRPEIRS